MAACVMAGWRGYLLVWVLAAVCGLSVSLHTSHKHPSVHTHKHPSVLTHKHPSAHTPTSYSTVLTNTKDPTTHPVDVGHLVDKLGNKASMLTHLYHVLAVIKDKHKLDLLAEEHHHPTTPADKPWSHILHHFHKFLKPEAHNVSHANHNGIPYKHYPKYYWDKLLGKLLKHKDIRKVDVVEEEEDCGEEEEEEDQGEEPVKHPHTMIKYDPLGQVVRKVKQLFVSLFHHKYSFWDWLLEVITSIKHHSAFHTVTGVDHHNSRVDPGLFGLGLVEIPPWFLWFREGEFLKYSINWLSFIGLNLLFLRAYEPDFDYNDYDYGGGGGDDEEEMMMMEEEEEEAPAEEEGDGEMEGDDYDYNNDPDQETDQNGNQDTANFDQGPGDDQNEFGSNQGNFGQNFDQGNNNQQFSNQNFNQFNFNQGPDDDQNQFGNQGNFDQNSDQGNDNQQLFFNQNFNQGTFNSDQGPNDDQNFNGDGNFGQDTSTFQNANQGGRFNQGSNQFGNQGIRRVHSDPVGSSTSSTYTVDRYHEGPSRYEHTLGQSQSTYRRPQKFIIHGRQTKRGKASTGHNERNYGHIRHIYGGQNMGTKLIVKPKPTRRLWGIFG